MKTKVHTIILLLLLALKVGPYAVANDRTAFTDDTYATAKLFYEDHWQKKIERAISYIPGAIVSVNVDLAIAKFKASDGTGFAMPTELRKPTISSNSVQKRAVNAGMPPANRTDPRVQPNLVTNERESSQHFSPFHVRVVVGVPSGYYRAVWGFENVGETNSGIEQPSSHELSEIQDKINYDITATVGMLLPHRAAGEDHFSPVLVSPFEDRISAKTLASGIASKACR